MGVKAYILLHEYVQDDDKWEIPAIPYIYSLMFNLHYKLRLVCGGCDVKMRYRRATAVILCVLVGNNHSTTATTR